jgi:predicted PurR-regulated permease PerM
MIERLITLILLAVLGLGCLYVLSPFFSALLWAAFLVLASWPAFLRLRRLGLPRGVAALAMVAFFRPYFGVILEHGFKLLVGIANGVAGFGFALFISFFFYYHGETLARWLDRLWHRLFGDEALRFEELIEQTVRGTVYGILGNAIVQGILTFFGLWLASVPRASFFGLLAGFLATIPVGAPLVWVPAMLWLFFTGATGAAAFLGAYGVIVIFGLDHVIRPILISRGARLPFLPTVLGVLGGAVGFGLLGIFLGPVLLGIGLNLSKEFIARDRSAKPVAAAPARASRPVEGEILGHDLL